MPARFVKDLIIRPSLTYSIVVFTLTLILLSCGGSSSDDDGGSGSSGNGTLSTNACGTLGLGTREVATRENTRVINGATCTEAGSPIVEISLLESSGDASLCSGTLLTSTHVLTAAHCFFDEVRIASVAVGGQRVTASTVTVHPGVGIVPGILAVFNDVAILTLRTPITNQPTLPLIVSESVDVGDIFGVFGFGLDENDELGELQGGEMRISEVTENHITALFDGSGSNSCSGDSGGPAVYTTTSGVTGIVGVVSSGTITNCTAGDNAIYANTQGASILNFITQVVPDVRLE